MLIWGGSHRVEAYQLEGKFFINPGSATGAFSTGWPDEDEETTTGADDVDGAKDGNGTVTTSDDPSNKNDIADSASAGEENNDDKEEDSDATTPSFCLLDIQGPVCVLYIYSLIDGEVKVDKVSYRKEIQ